MRLMNTLLRGVKGRPRPSLGGGRSLTPVAARM
jgi:hypothetical protein